MEYDTQRHTDRQAGRQTTETGTQKTTRYMMAGDVFCFQHDNEHFAAGHNAREIQNWCLFHRNIEVRIHQQVYECTMDQEL